MIFDSLLGLFSVDMGIDLGTCNTLVCVKGEGIVLNEPSVVAVRKGTNQVLRNGNAVGHVAKEMLGRTPGSIQAIRPLKDGVIADFDITEAMLGYFIRKVHGRSRLIKPRVVIAVPSGITAVEKRAVYNSAERAGARRVYLVEEPMAAGIGAGLPIGEATASMIVDIGGGTTEVAIMTLADIAVVQSIRTAGDEMDAAIVAYMRRKHDLMIGLQTAEKIKIELGSVCPLEQEMSMKVRGRDVVGGLPKECEITSMEVREALGETIGQIVACVMRTLESTEPELAADLVENGIHLAGGGALLRGLDRAIAERTGLIVKVVDDPLSCVARGTAVYLENLSAWKETMESDADDY
ncbi:MAG: rod shape-determining protein [Phycisphaerales bacterium]|nr:rod shape-determining protein [Phycisphaerales bacterium]